jgi:DNA-nicking Smr family endonuclease
MTINKDDDKDEDRELFRDAVQGVRPLRPGNRLHGGGPAPAPRPRQQEADDRAVLVDMMDDAFDLTLDSGEELSYRTDGIQDAAFRKLKRGLYRAGLELDLHGQRSDEAKAAVSRFLVHCQERDIRCVRIIHGKGLRSKGDGPVLKRRLDGWLRQRKEVLAFCSARPQDGGTGAVNVLLRKIPA